VYVSVTRTTTAEDAVETARIVGDEMERWLRELDGFQGLVVLLRPGESLGLSFWSSAEAAERQRAVRAEFRERMLTLAGVTIESVDGYEVAFARIAPDFGAGLSEEQR
jgi:hypothetical protein